MSTCWLLCHQWFELCLTVSTVVVHKVCVSTKNHKNISNIVFQSSSYISLLFQVFNNSIDCSAISVITFLYQEKNECIIFITYFRTFISLEDVIVSCYYCFSHLSEILDTQLVAVLFLLGDSTATLLTEVSVMMASDRIWWNNSLSSRIWGNNGVPWSLLSASIEWHKQLRSMGMCKKDVTPLLKHCS